MAQVVRLLLLSLLLLLFCSCAQSFTQRRNRGDSWSTEKHPTDRWFQQMLNHFSKNGSSFWSQAVAIEAVTWGQLAKDQIASEEQRYFINDIFYKPGGPVFLFIKGENAASRQMVTGNNTWTTYAERLGALCLLLEHRFYGHSQPTGDLSTASLRYLNSRQALADIVNFRTQIAKTMGLTKNKWVIFGGSYGGSLAVWSRIKRPDLFFAAVGSSAPMLAKVNFYEYLEIFYRTLTTYNIECARAVEKAFTLIVALVKIPEYYSMLADDFMLCEPLKINSEMDAAFFLHKMIYFIRIELNKITIDDFCDLMTDTSLGSPYNRFATIANMKIINKKWSCLYANYSAFLEYFSLSSLDMQSIRRGRQWFYQCCTEFGFFQTTDSNNHPFSGLPLRYYVKRCSDVFGTGFNYDSLTWRVKANNIYYGGFNVNGSKIIFSNGSNDPWHFLGITKDISRDLPAVFMKGEIHCADMYKQMDTDSHELIQAREKIFQILQKWLKQ
nr:putative serine protease K12H4.7 [Loxodonta africana]